MAMLACEAVAADSEMKLAAAIHREVVLGDLPGAIQQYRDIAAQPGATAARALFRMAGCQEKLGQRREAHATYQRVVNEYADQTEVAAEARAKLADWLDSLPGPRNVTFEQGQPGKAPPGWFVPALPKDADFLAELHREGCRSRTGCAVVQAPANAPNPLGNLMQSFSAAAYRGKTVRLRASLRMQLSAPDDHAQMWLSVDRANRQQNAFLNDRSVRSPDWTRCEIVTRIAEDATFINFGVMSIGRGRVWVDEVSFEVIP